MNINDLRKIISEEVTKATKKVFRSELRDILLEVIEKQEGQITDVQSFEAREDYQETKSLSDILQETKKGMNREDYRNFLENSFDSSKPETILSEKKAVPVMEGMPDFLQRAALNAKKVLDLSNKKDQEKNGL